MSSLGKCKRRYIGIVFDGLENRAKLNRAEHKEDGHNAKRQTKVSDPVGYKRLDRGIIWRFLLEPETDQQIRRQSHTFPTKEKLQEVIGHHQHQHGEGKERQIGKETSTMGILGHIAP